MAITTKAEGARLYILGDTYALRDRLKQVGCHWDGDRKAWWIGQAKAAAVQSLIASAPPATSSTEPAGSHGGKAPERSAEVKARATYKGRDYYVLAETHDGRKVLLAARNGEFQFWADAQAAQINKTYGRENYRTGRVEYPTLDGMIRRADKWRRMSADERADARDDAEARRNGEQCPCSGGACRCGSDSPCCMCW